MRDLYFKIKGFLTGLFCFRLGYCNPDCKHRAYCQDYEEDYYD